MAESGCIEGWPVLGNKAGYAARSSDLTAAREQDLHYLFDLWADVFDMYARHQGAQSLMTHFSAPDISFVDKDKNGSVWGINGSASRSSKRVKLTFVDTGFDQPRNIQIALRGANISSVSGRALASHDLHSHNTFEQPDAVQLKPLEVVLGSGLAHIVAPAGSVVSLDFAIA